MNGYKFIDKIGIELEAAWKQPKPGLVVDESFSHADFSPEFKGVGEFVSHPIASKEEMLDWLHAHWPDETCPKCAMHVHFSLNHINYYSACMSSRFYDFFLNEMEKWGKNYNCRNDLFWQRLRGDNRYCRKRFNPDVQVKYMEKGHNRQDRRDHWNFCYGLHKTMECRLLPMFKNIETAKSAIFALINCIETYIEQYTQEEKHVVDELFDFDCIPEEKEVYTEKHEDRYQELSNTAGLSAVQRNELMKLMSLRKAHKSPKREKSKFKFNFFEIYNPNVNGGGNPCVIKLSSPKRNVRFSDVAEESPKYLVDETPKFSKKYEEYTKAIRAAQDSYIKLSTQPTIHKIAKNITIKSPGYNDYITTNVNSCGYVIDSTSYAPSITQSTPVIHPDKVENTKEIALSEFEKYMLSESAPPDIKKD